MVIFVPLLLMDTVGRRPLLIASNVGICLAQILISMSFLLGSNMSSGGVHTRSFTTTMYNCGVILEHR